MRARYLLDTHTFLYLALFREPLPARLRPLIEDVRNDLHVSLASLWEIQIKTNIGKLDIDGPLTTLVTSSSRKMGWLLPIDIVHVVEHNALPLRHRDPFDRMLIAQARVEGNDPPFEKRGLRRVRRGGEVVTQRTRRP